MNSVHNRRSIGFVGRLAAAGTVCAVWAVSPLQAQSLTDAYRGAAQTYRDAAAKATASRRPCFLEWAKYYDDYAAAVQRGSGEPSQPSLDPGCPASASGSGASSAPGASAATAGTASSTGSSAAPTYTGNASAASAAPAAPVRRTYTAEEEAERRRGLSDADTFADPAARLKSLVNMERRYNGDEEVMTARRATAQALVDQATARMVALFKARSTVMLAPGQVSYSVSSAGNCRLEMEVAIHHPITSTYGGQPQVFRQRHKVTINMPFKEADSLVAHFQNGGNPYHSEGDGNNPTVNLSSARPDAGLYWIGTRGLSYRTKKGEEIVRWTSPDSGNQFYDLYFGSVQDAERVIALFTSLQEGCKRIY